jgi:hypothetical protein
LLGSVCQILADYHKVASWNQWNLEYLNKWIYTQI